MTVPFGPTPADRALLDRVAALAAGFAADAAGYDERAEIPVANLDALRDAGVTRAILPVALGGDGMGYQGFGELVRLVAKGDPSTATILTMHTGAGVGLAELTRDSLGTFFADELLAGKRFANALSEPTSGNRFLNPQQEARPVDGGWALDGTKRFVSGSEIADYLLVNAQQDRRRGRPARGADRRRLGVPAQLAHPAAPARRGGGTAHWPIRPRCSPGRSASRCSA